MKVTRLLTVMGIVLVSVALACLVLEAANQAGLSITLASSALQTWDFGDAPDPTYPTLFTNDGARHYREDDGGLFLGYAVDREPDGWPDALAQGDDLDNLDDEDGARFVSPLVVGQVAQVDLWASAEGLLNAWLDFNGNGNWADVGEQIFIDEPLSPQTNTLTLQVPGDATPGVSFSRWRFSSQRGLSYTGEAPDGEVEDHWVEILPPKPEGVWEKLINGVLWEPGISFTVETSDTIDVREVVRTEPGAPFTLIEHWNPENLRLAGYEVIPPGFSQVNEFDDRLQWVVEADHPGELILIKQFHVEPCTWPGTELMEELQGLTVEEPFRPVGFRKVPPVLGISAEYEREVYAGMEVSFTLAYGNEGGYENNVSIRNDFPREARFVWSSPEPSDWDMDARLWAEWDVGDLAMGQGGSVVVTVTIAPNLPLSTSLVITDDIRNHLLEPADTVTLTFHVTQPTEPYWKRPWPDYAPSGLPDFDQKQDAWSDPQSRRWTFCGPVAVANSLWWYDSAFEPEPMIPSGNLNNDHYPLVTSYGDWDDHWIENTVPLVNDLARYFNTSPQTGTNVYDIYWGLQQYLYDRGLYDDYLVTLAAAPDMGWVIDEVMRSEDVILLLGFWQQVEGQGWVRRGGHYVTVAGVDPGRQLIAFSDPFVDRAEAGWPGRVLSGTLILPHIPPHGPDVHNDAGNISHDSYPMVPTDSPGGLWGPGEYVQAPDDVLNFLGQNPHPELETVPELGPEPIQVEVEYAIAMSPFFWKRGGWEDYAPAGMPDFGQRQDGWRHPPSGRWSYCGPAALANSLWWFDSKFEPEPVPPPVINDHFSLVKSYGDWDDHDPLNVETQAATFEFVDDLARYLGTDVVGRGTHIDMMRDGLSQYLADHGLSEAFTVTLAPQPEWEWIVHEVVRSEDVILLLGFWQWTQDGWLRLGGHYVTVAGVDPMAGLVGFSDPFFDQAELGWPWLGRVLPLGSHPPHPGIPDTQHNDAAFVSHDVYRVVPSPSPGGIWGLKGYPVTLALENFEGQNGELTGPVPGEPPPDPSLVYPEIEWALAVSPLAGWLEGQVMDSELVDLVPPCTPASVQIGPALSMEVPADPATGFYGPVMLLAGAYDASASAPGYSVETATVQVASGMTTTQDFNLWRPVIGVAPSDFISVTTFVSVPVTHTLIISNQGHVPLEFEIGEGANGDLPWVSEDPISGTVPQLSEVLVDVTFHCTEAGEYDGALRVGHNDPCQAPVEIPIRFHCEELPPPEWGKWVNGQPWTDSLVITAQTTDTITVTDVITTLGAFVLKETWDGGHLKLEEWFIDPPGTGIVDPIANGLVWAVLPGPPEVMTITKVLHVEPCTWTVTILEETLWVGDEPVDNRPVQIYKRPPQLTIDSSYNPEVYPGEVVSFTLLYGNNGGYENDVWIRNDFPPEALFVDSSPPPEWQAADGSGAVWRIGDLAMDEGGQIDVTVAISPGLEVTSTIVITDYIYDHIGEVVDQTTISYHVGESPPQPEDADIYLKDNPLDDGSVPSVAPWWVSPDIWVRTDGDCSNTEHQNPLAGRRNTICVRVRNRMATTVHDITVGAYWGSAALGFHWPGGWSIAGSAHITSLAGGAEAVRAIPWNTPNITDHFCLLVRVDSLEDSVGWGPDTTVPQDHVPNNNNISMLNLNIVNFPEVTECGFYTTTVDTDVVYLDVVNTTNHSATVDVVFDSADFPLDSGQISVDPGGLWGRWSSRPNFDGDDPPLLATGFPASMVGMQMEPYETVRMTVTITAEIDERFTLHVSERIDGKLIGGIHYLRELPHCIFLPQILRDFTVSAATRVEPASLLTFTPGRTASLDRSGQPWRLEAARATSKFPDRHFR